MAPRQPRLNDDILFVGMNKAGPGSAGAGNEISYLRSRGIRVETVVDSPETVGQGRVKIGNQTHDLGQPAGRNAFVALLRLPPDQAQKVAAVIDEAQDKAKDEVAGIASVWARAEKGQAVPPRMGDERSRGGLRGLW